MIHCTTSTIASYGMRSSFLLMTMLMLLLLLLSLWLRIKRSSCGWTTHSRGHHRAPQEAVHIVVATALHSLFRLMQRLSARHVIALCTSPNNAEDEKSQHE